MLALKEKINNIQVEDIEKSRKQDFKEYLNLVHLNDDGFITIATKNKYWQQYHFSVEEIEENIDKIINLETNTYISINSFYKPFRAIENIRKINAVYMEWDCHTAEIDKKEIDLLLYKLEDNYFYKKVPMPSLIVFSGRGLHFYWLLENLPKQAIPLWTMVKDKMVKELEDVHTKNLELDKNSTDLARVYRIPGTLNIKASENCSILLNSNIRYRLDNLVKYYFPDLEYKKNNNKTVVKKEKKQNDTDNKVKKIFNLYSLHYNRMLDFVKLIDLRSGDLKGNREFILFLYRYYTCLFLKDTDAALESTINLNNKFKQPLTQSEVISATRSAEIAFKRWQEDNTKGYNYRNSTLIKKLEITEKEQEQMLAIIGKEEKYRRKNIKRTPRNKNGLTKKQQELKEQEQQVKELRQQGLSMQKIAVAMGISKSKVVKLANL